MSPGLTRLGRGFACSDSYRRDMRCLMLVISASKIHSSVGKESACDAGDPSSIPGLARSLRGGHGNPLQYSCLENPHGQRSLAGCSPPSLKELDTTEQPSTHTVHPSSPKSPGIQDHHLTYSQAFLLAPLCYWIESRFPISGHRYWIILPL